jgi:hypothetical protein
MATRPVMLTSRGGFGIGISPRQAAMTKLNSDLSAQGYNPHDMQQLMLDATRAYGPQFSPPHKGDSLAAVREWDAVNWVRAYGA